MFLKRIDATDLALLRLDTTLGLYCCLDLSMALLMSSLGRNLSWELFYLSRFLTFPSKSPDLRILAYDTEWFKLLRSELFVSSNASWPYPSVRTLYLLSFGSFSSLTPFIWLIWSSWAFWSIAAEAFIGLLTKLSNWLCLPPPISILCLYDDPRAD